MITQAIACDKRTPQLEASSKSALGASEILGELIDINATGGGT
jgi:hypothetical protein